MCITLLSSYSHFCQIFLLLVPDINERLWTNFSRVNFKVNFRQVNGFICQNGDKINEIPHLELVTSDFLFVHSTILVFNTKGMNSL